VPDLPARQGSPLSRRNHRKRTEACDLLAPIGWFTESFDTPKALLADLG
jgi:hypothetical protein